MNLGDDNLILRVGPGKFCQDGDYLFSACSWPENLFSGIPRQKYLFSPATKNFKKQKKKKKTKTKPGGGGSECWLRRETGQKFPSYRL